MQNYIKNKEPEAIHLAWWQRLFQFGLPLVVIALGVFIAKKIIDGKVKPQRKPKPAMIARADVVTVNQANCRVKISAMGTVIPAEDLALKARVSGEVVEINPALEMGRQIKAGEWAIKIDPSDYTLALNKAKIQKKKVEVDLLLEKGRQAVAEQEFKLFDKRADVSELDKELALRKPQLDLATANLELADNEIEKRKLDLSRCTISLPFNALVSKKVVTLGMQVNAQQTIVQLIRSDFFYIEASVPIRNLSWLDLTKPEENKVTIFYNNNRSERQGRILRVLNSVETKGRMARLLIAVDKPLESRAVKGEAIPLLLGTYVRLDINGRHMNDAFKIPRCALRDGNKAWVAVKADPGNAALKANGHILYIRPITIAWKNRDYIFVKDGLNSGDAVIVSDLPAAVEGMPVKLAKVNGEPVMIKPTAAPKAAGSGRQNN